MPAQIAQELAADRSRAWHDHRPAGTSPSSRATWPSASSTWWRPAARWCTFGSTGRATRGRWPPRRRAGSETAGRRVGFCAVGMQGRLLHCWHACCKGAGAAPRPLARDGSCKEHSKRHVMPSSPCRKEGRDRIFHIDEGQPGRDQTPDTWQHSQRPTADPITAITASTTTLLVSMRQWLSLRASCRPPWRDSSRLS